MNPVLVATDLGPTSGAVVEAAKRLANSIGADLIALHVVTPEMVKDYEDSQRPGEAYIDVLYDRLGGDVRAQLGGLGAELIVPGEAAETILATAEARACGNIVLGVRNRSKVGKLLLGSVAQEVLLNAPCPVLAVPV
jgi:nucleotide-binding universal stress UspA family protein